MIRKAFTLLQSKFVGVFTLAVPDVYISFLVLFNDSVLYESHHLRCR